MTEAQEIAMNIAMNLGLHFLYDEIITRDDARRIAQEQMEGENATVIDDVAEEIYILTRGQE